MLVNFKKNNYQSIFQNFKSSFISFYNIRISKPDSIIKKVALAVINLLLVPFKLAQGAYSKLFKIKMESKKGLLNIFFDKKTLIKKITTKNKPATAFIVVGISSLITLSNRPSHQKGLLADSIVKFISSNKFLSFSALGLGIGSIIFINRRINSEKITPGESPLNKIKKSEECCKVFKPILDNPYFSSSEKLNSIRAQIQAEVSNFKIKNPECIISFVEGNRKNLTLKAQIHFAEVLINELKIKFPYEDFSKIEGILKNIKDEKKLNQVEKGNQINNALAENLRSNYPLINQVKELDIRNKGLKVVLPCIEEFTALQSLYLGDNELTFLPESIGKLTNLKELYLHNNQITVLPESIGKLKSLEFICLSNNQLTTLPTSIGCLKNLKCLMIEKNQFTTLPESMSKLELKDLYLEVDFPLPEFMNKFMDIIRQISS